MELLNITVESRQSLTRIARAAVADGVGIESFASQFYAAWRSTIDGPSELTRENARLQRV
jgi:hypothetical protein